MKAIMGQKSAYFKVIKYYNELPTAIQAIITHLVTLLYVENMWTWGKYWKIASRVLLCKSLDCNLFNLEAKQSFLFLLYDWLLFRLYFIGNNIHHIDTVVPENIIYVRNQWISDAICVEMCLQRLILTPTGVSF